MSKALVVEGALVKRAVLTLVALACAALGVTTLPAAAYAETAGSATVAGRVVDGTGAPVAATIYVLVNRDGGLKAEGTPVSTANGYYTVTAPAGQDVAVLAQLAGGPQAWLSGGGVSEPNAYLVLTDGETRHVQDIDTGGGRLAVTSAPRLRGIAGVGHYLAASTGVWNARPGTYRYQWLRNGQRIRGAYAATYRLTGADAHRTISVQVVALRTGFGTGSARSSRLVVR